MEAVLNKEIISSKTISRLVGVVTFVILTCLGAFVRIPLPFSPVPITLQTFFVLLCGAFLGGLGTWTQLIYVLLGVGGLPVFSGAGSGWLYLAGPTGGYIFGFILANLFLSRFMREVQRLSSVIFIFVLADAIILCAGVFWLKVIFSGSWMEVLVIGLLPFIPGDLLKILLASSILVRLKSRLKEIF